MEVVDPYEQYLLAVFESCDDYNQGSLSAAGLQQLCEKLQLQDHYGNLSKNLLGSFETKRVLFHEFKDGLLKLLNSTDCDSKTDGEVSDERKVPLKYVYENKKFSRHSKLESNEIEGLLSDDETHQKAILPCSTDEYSSSEEYVPKKRCTKVTKKNGKSSLNKTGKNDSSSESQQTSPVTSTVNEVEHLVTAWSNISRGVTDSLGRDELVRVFQCVGLERGSEEAAECVLEKLGLDENGRITLQELLEFIRSGGSWSKVSGNQHMELEAGQKNVSMEFIEPASLGCVTGASLVEQWECAGVPGAPQLLQHLGFSPSQQIDLSSLVTILTEEIKGLNEEVKSTRRTLDPQVALLRANSVLQNLYIQSLKTTIEHVNAEKEKLRNDVFDANQRALLLAQEVDDHHSKLEHSTQQQVKVLEQKHAEKVRELTNQAKCEQDALLAQNAVLERKLKVLEEEEGKNKIIMSQLELENKILEQEHRAIADQLAAVQLVKEKLEKDLENVSILQQRISEMEATLSENDVSSLLERIQSLESENTSLRDRNDELSIEVEELTTKLLNTSIKKRSPNPPSTDQPMEESLGVGGMKRRGDSFVLIESAEDSEGDEGSPRLGKVRKCSHAKEFAEATSSLKELQIHGGNRGECIDEDPCRDSPNLIQNEDVTEFKKDTCKIIPVSEELEQAGGMSPVPPPLPDHCNEEIKLKVLKIYGKLQKHDKNLGHEMMIAMKEILEEKPREKDKDTVEGLRKRCKDLESSLELLREEYEKTEDYWSEKLEEERGFFEEEQKISDKKYMELLEKILEYEEMLNSEREQRQRLETIEEKDSFEKQVADMEQECSELRQKLAETVREKDAEMDRLRKEMSATKTASKQIECGVQTSGGDSTDSNDTNRQNSMEGSNRKSFPLSQNDHKWSQSGCRQCGDFKNLQEARMAYRREVEFLREERERLFKEMTEKSQKLNSCAVGCGNERLHDLEQKCHSLMITLRQQQKQTEDILKNTWKQHKAEVKDLKSVLKMTEEKLKCQTKVIQEQLAKLAKTDLLVKDLFVENAYLISSVQKLEQQCSQTRGNSTKSSH